MSAMNMLKEYLNTETGEVITEKELYIDYLTVSEEVKEAFPNFELWKAEVTGKNGIFEKIPFGYWVKLNGANYAFCNEKVQAESVAYSLIERENKKQIKENRFYNISVEVVEV